MRQTKWLSGALFLLGCSAGPLLGQQIGKFVPIQAGSDVDHALTEINAATDAAQKLALIEKFAAGPGSEGDYPLVADGLFVDYYIGQKKYNKDGIAYIQQAVFSGAYQAKDPAKRAGLLTRFAQIFPDSPYANQALGVAATAYQQAQNAPKMLEVANGLLAKDPNNLGMLLLCSDYYGEKGEQLDKAEAYAKKAVAVLQTAEKPEGVTDEQWAQQKALQKGLALSSLGQVNIQKKDNAQAAENLKAAAPLLKPDDGSYARNQYRLGFALLNLKRNAEAKEAFTQAASVNRPYKALAQEKLRASTGAELRKMAKMRSGSDGRDASD